MELPIVKLPTPSLRERSVEITKDILLSENTQKFIDDMIPTMYGDDGIGLAAPQVGKNIRVCVIGKEADKGLSDDLVLVNPVWEKNSPKTKTEDEGCLSVPGKFGKVKRFTNIHVDALDRHGNPLSFEAKHFFARVIQHEVDHLNGILFIDKATDIYEVDPVELKKYKEKRKAEI
jgi:peptide deformylase